MTAKHERKANLIKYINDNIKHMAEGHIEVWVDRYREYKTKKQLRFDLFINHDPSLEIERVEADLKIILTDKERNLLVDKFNKQVCKSFKVGRN